MRAIHKLSRRFASGTSDLLTHIENTVKQLIRTHADIYIEEIDTQKEFKEIDIDDFERTRIVVEIEEFYKISFTDEEFSEINTPFDVVLLINRYLAKEYSISNIEDGTITI